MTTDTPRTDAFMASMFEKTDPFTLTLTLDGFARQLERELAEARKDADANAPWLSAAHALCTDMGVPQGNISERIEALREVVMEARKDAEWLANNTDHPHFPYLRDGRWHIVYEISSAGGFGGGVGESNFPTLHAAIDAAIAKETK